MPAHLHRRALLVCLVLVAGLTRLSWQLVDIQHLNPLRLTNQKAIDYEFRENLPAPRGLILDRNETTLAQNRPVANLIADKTHLRHLDNIRWGVAYHRLSKEIPGFEALPETEKTEALKKKYRAIKNLDPKLTIDEHLDFACETLAAALRIPAEEIRAAVGRKPMEIIVAKGIRNDDAHRLEEVMDERRIQGFRFKRYFDRTYAAGTLAPHVVGFVDGEGDGKMGIERTMDPVLRGEDGYRIRKKNQHGLLIASQNSALQPARPGNHVKLTLDSGLQGIAEEELDAALSTYQAKKGTIIVMDPYSGDVLAMANRPHFDLNLREGVSEAGMNFAVQGRYEPGSIFKIVAMSAAVDLGRANLNTVVNCGYGELVRDGYRVPDHHAYGDLTFREVMAKSSNTGAFLFGERIGKAQFYNYLRSFGFGEITGFPLGGESAGTVNNGERDVDFSRVTYGYAVSTTPLQIATAYGVLANGGELVRPRLIDQIIADDGTVVTDTPVEVRHRVVSEATARQMREALSEVISIKGTGKRAAVPGFTVAGKTGTAWKYIPDERRYDPKRKAITFAGMLPAEEPAFVCVVMIDEPQLGADELSPSGGSVGAPVFARVAARVAARMNLKPTLPTPDAIATSLP